MSDATMTAVPAPAQPGQQLDASPGQAIGPGARATRWRRSRSYATVATPLLLAGFAVALVTQYAIFAGAKASAAAMGYVVAVLVFLSGLLVTSDTGVLTWPGPLARRPKHAPGQTGPRTPPAAPGAVTRAPATGPAGAPVAPPLTTPGGTVAARPVAAGRPARVSQVSGTLLLTAIGLGAVTFLASGGNQFHLLNTTTWVVSVACALSACWERSATSHTPLGHRLRRATRVSAWPPAVTLRVAWTGVALALILAVGLFLLYFRIYDVPRDMTSDHAEKLLDVRDVLDGQHHIFFPRNTGREAFQFYWIAIMTPLTGISYLTMKLGTALLEFFALPFTFLLARVFFPTPLALLSTGVMAITRWHLQVARVGLRFPFPPLFGAATFYFLLKAIRDRRRNDFLLCGVMLGIGQHTYTALRVAPLAVVGCLAIALVVDVWQRRPVARVHALVRESALLGLVAILAFMPLGRYAFDQPSMFLFRGVTRIAGDSGGAPPPHVLGVFLDNVKNAFLFFNWHGDLVWTNTIPEIPMLDPVSGALFVLGCAYGLFRLIRHRELPFLYLFVLLFVGMLPSILSLAFPVENPSTVRMGMALPITVILIATPLYLLVRRLAGWVGGRAGLATGAIALAAALLLIFQDNFHKYYFVYAAQHAQSSQHTSAVGRAVNGFLALGGQRQDVHIFPGAYWIDSRLVAIEAGDIRWDPLVRSLADVRAQDGVDRPRLLIVKPDDHATLDTLGKWYPTAIEQEHALAETKNQPWFVTVLLPPGVRAQA